MKRLLPSAQRGQALILLALAGIGLFAIAGLAIDGSAKFSDRRHAQNAADTAALAAALAMARADPQWDLEALDRALENGYDDNHLSNEVEVYNPPASGIYSDCGDVHFDCNDYVQVIIDSTVNTFFARVVGINQTHNHVEAVASTITENNNFNFGGNAVVALNTEGCALMAMGGSNVTVDGGGLYSNSDHQSCSFQGGSCASYLEVKNEDGSQGDITLVGGYNYGKSCQPQATVLPASAKQIPFPPPYEELAEPAECSSPAPVPNGTTVTLTPGYYTKMPPKNNMTDVTLQPGVYCIGTALSLNNTAVMRVAGTFSVDPGVLLYFKPGGSFTFNGGSGVQLWGINDANVAIDPSLAPYKGFLIYIAPDYSGGTPANCKINGHSGDPLTGATGDAFQGTIYAPYCDITLSGTSDETGFQTQLIGYNVKFAGGANVHLTYDDDSSPSWNIPLQVSLSK